MGLQIIIDGYNLIRQSRKFNQLDLVNLQMGREALIDSLAAYKKIKAHPIKVVFDGQSAPAGSPHKERIKGIELIYSRSGELADAVIKRLADRYGEKLLVVTSDSDIVRYVQSRGAATIGSREFEDRLMIRHLFYFNFALNVNYEFVTYTTAGWYIFWCSSSCCY